MIRDKILDVIDAIDILESKMSVLYGANWLHMAQLDSMRTYMLEKLDQEEIEMIDYVEGDKLGNVQRLHRIIGTFNGRKVIHAKQKATGVEFVLEVFTYKDGGKEEHLLMIMPNDVNHMAELEYYLEYLSIYTAILLNGHVFKGKQWKQRQKEAQRWEEEYDEEYWEE